MVDRFRNRIYLNAIGIGDEGRVYLRRMTNVVKNRLDEHHTSLAEATDDLKMLDGKLASTLSSSLTDAFSKFGSSVLSNLHGAGSHLSRVADKSKDAPECENLNEVLTEMATKPLEGWLDYEAKELDKDRVTLRPSGDAKAVQIRRLPFAFGSERNAYLLRVEGEGKLYVAKELRKRKPKEDHRFQRYKVQEDEYKHKLLEAHKIVGELAERFTQELNKAPGLAQLPTVKCQAINAVYELTEVGGGKSSAVQDVAQAVAQTRFVAVEDFMQGEFIKMNNNSGGHWSAGDHGGEEIYYQVAQTCTRHALAFHLNRPLPSLPLPLTSFPPTPLPPPSSLISFPLQPGGADIHPLDA
jgi:hypothetical protein